MSVISRDKIIVVDIEATCWKNHQNPPGQHNEIIEIGVCLLDTLTYTTSHKQSILVKPTRSTVSAFCTELTTLTQEQVDAGLCFGEACDTVIRDYAAKRYLWGSWGTYDRKLFQRQCGAYGVNYPFSHHYVNIKKLFAKLENRHKQIGMTRALDKIGLPVEGVHHRGDDDAWNTSRILAHLLEKHGHAILDNNWR